MTIDSNLTRHTSVTSTSGRPRETNGAEFHRLARARTGHRWWKPLLVGVVAAVIYVASFLLLMVVLGIGGGVFPAFENVMGRFLQDPDTVDLSDPFSFAFAMGMLILWIPSLLLATRLVGPRPVSLLASVVGRLRWRWLVRCGVVALSIYAVAYAASILVAVAQGESFVPEIDMPRVLLLLGLTIVLVPLQSAAEEYVFRGYLMQMIGSWLRHPAFAILLPVPLFVLGHGYGPLGTTDVAVFAIAAGWLTWRTGGLEAAIALHVVGNVSVFALAAVGLLDVNATEVGVASLLVSIAVTLTFVTVVARLARRHSIERRAVSSDG
ncbi:MAG: type II CAAX endopeptidase family protein [Propionibacteriaceae bacterium]|nr:type II CAAX endopeptidase family protein [Propionibacteriaceae bacterium]